MKAKVTRNALKKINELLEANPGKKIRIVVQQSHGNHVHYGLALDVPTENDEVIVTERGVELVLEKGNDWLDGVRVDYLYSYQNLEGGWVITNSSKGNHGDH